MPEPCRGAVCDDGDDLEYTLHENKLNHVKRQKNLSHLSHKKFYLCLEHLHHNHS